MQQPGVGDELTIPCAQAARRRKGSPVRAPPVPQRAARCIRERPRDLCAALPRRLALCALLASAGCATLQAEGAVGLGAAGPQGRDIAREAARGAARALGGQGTYRCELDHDGVDDRVTCVSEGPESPDVRLEKRGERWWATAEVLPRPPGWLEGLGVAPRRASGEAEGSDPGLALARAEARALASLVRGEVAAHSAPGREGRYALRLVPTRRGLRLVGEKARVALEVLATEVVAAPLPPEARCALPRQALRQHLGTGGARDGGAKGGGAEGLLTRLERAEAACGPLAGAVAAAARRAFLAGDTERGAALIGRLAALPDELALRAARGPDPAEGPAHAPARRAEAAEAPTTPAPPAPTAADARIQEPPCPAGSVLLAGGAVALDVAGRREVRQVAPFCLMVTEAWEGFPTRRPGRWPQAAARWSEADEACRRAGGRLPTEAEWAYAAAGTEERTYPWGDAGPDCTRANTEACGGAAMALGGRPAGASPEGVLDLGGNLREWTADPWVPASGDAAEMSPPSHVLRGGDFSRPAAMARSATRGGGDLHDDVRDATVGFRCAYDIAR